MIPSPCGWVEFVDLLHAVFLRAGSQKSAVAEHTLKQTGHEILFQNAEILDNTSNHYVRLHREAIEIHKHQQNFNKKEESVKLNKTWLPALKIQHAKGQ